MRRKKIITTTILLGLCAFLLIGEKEKEKEVLLGQNAWRGLIQKLRLEKDMEFRTSKKSPMAGAKRLTVEAGKVVYVLVRLEGIYLSDKNEIGALFSLEGQKGQWRWNVQDDRVTCRAGNKAIKPGDLLAHSNTFQVARFTLSAYTTNDTLTLIVFDPQRPEMVDFKHLYYYAPDPAYAVATKMEIFPKVEKVKMLTSQNLEKTFYKYAKLHFKIDGKELTLTAFKYSLEGEDAKFLFIPFKDSTNDKETYGVGRFIDIEDPGVKDFILDFNLAYNPLCNYSPAYNCPIPPLENFLEVPIRAGEKIYPH